MTSVHWIKLYEHSKVYVMKRSRSYEVGIQERPNVFKPSKYFKTKSAALRFAKSYIKKNKKSLSWKEAKAKYSRLSSRGDADKDGVINKKDCRPFDKKRQDLDSNDYFSDADLFVTPKVYNAFHDLRRGIPSSQLSKNYSDSEIDSAFDVLNEVKRGKRVKPYYYLK